jgi:ADP-ribosylglycohydrolase
MKTIPTRERILGALWGAVVGDALGVPVEFKDREQLRLHPVSDFLEYGTHSQPRGTWSDDTSLALCTMESLLRGFDTADMGRRFVDWLQRGKWTPHGKVFDIGLSTSAAIKRLASGTPAEQAGATDPDSNGNGSLMRMLPVALYFATHPPRQILDAAHRASVITHGHARALMACGYYSLLVAQLLHGRSMAEAGAAITPIFRREYELPPFASERAHFNLLLDGTLAAQPERVIRSSGYVMDTLIASIWCLHHAQSFEDAALRAVNLGGDTDTTGTVAGGLAGVMFGRAAIPRHWCRLVARALELDRLFETFTDTLIQPSGHYDPAAAWKR